MTPALCRCCGNKPEPGTECEECGRVGTRPVTKREILLAIQTQIETLRKSYTCANGPEKGRITEAGIGLEIVCLTAAVGIVMESKTP